MVSPERQARIGLQVMLWTATVWLPTWVVLMLIASSARGHDAHFWWLDVSMTFLLVCLLPFLGGILMLMHAFLRKY